MEYLQGKYLGYIYSDRQQRARKRWQVANDIRSPIIDSLLAHTVNPTRANLHRKLDKQLDRIESLERKALADFPDVADSFTIVTYNL